MRITKQQAHSNKARVVETAAALFREKGFDRVSVADLMHGAGLTHGGFYNHFSSKDDLGAAACAHVFDKSVAAVEAIAKIEAAPKRAEALNVYKRKYVSRKGRDATAASCPMVAFAGDVSRQSEPLREEYAAGLRRYLDAFARAVGCEIDEGTVGPGARQRAIAQFASLTGALTLARSVAEADPELSDEILEAAVAAIEADASD
jgi:TetR/AcrR family transcriptional regulator, transcriptional repressor for nem operon